MRIAVDVGAFLILGMAILAGYWTLGPILGSKWLRLAISIAVVFAFVTSVACYEVHAAVSSIGPFFVERVFLPLVGASLK